MWKKLKFIAVHKAHYAGVLKEYIPVVTSQAVSWRLLSVPGETVYLDVEQSTNRSLFNLVWILVQCGHRVLVPHVPVRLSQMGECDKWIFRFPQVRLTRRDVFSSKAVTLITDQPERYADRAKLPRLLELSFRYYDSPRPKTAMLLPFGCHPRARLRGLERVVASDPVLPRPQRVFFAGNISAPEYRQDRIPRRFGILNRHDFIEIAMTYARENSPAVANAMRLVDQGPDGHGLPMQEYFAQLARSAFVLCPPGVNHPQCHNLEEAMLSGAVPVLEYGNLLAEPLRDGENSIAFRGPDGLRQALDRIMSLAEHEIALLRQGAIRYAEAHLIPASLRERLASTSVQQLVILNELQST